MNLRSYLGALALGLGFALIGNAPEAVAQEQESARAPVVIELFTSQGCSSCPPADALLHELAARDDVIALALHVDYWDYIGWKDAFALPGHTARQKAYAKAAGRRMIYTPQMIINGANHVVGNRPMDVNELIAMHLEQPNSVRLSTSRDGDAVTIHATAEKALEKSVRVRLVRYNPLAMVEITRGENAGRTISYANIVQSWADLGLWDSSAPFEAEIEVTGPEKAVVLMQLAEYGPIVAARELP